MTDQIVLTIPKDISERARQIAEATELPVEQVLLDYLQTLTPSLPILAAHEQAELEALQHLSDDALWTMAREQMPDDAQARAETLMSQQTLTENEQEELDRLVERADRLMLRKAEAGSILTQRGHPFMQKDFKPPHD